MPIRLTARAVTAALLLTAPCAAAPAPRAAAPAALPQASVVTNLRSITGRTSFLILRPASGEVDGLRDRAERMAQAASAKLKLRAAGPLWVAVIEHESKGLDVHRYGRELRLDEGPLGSLDDALGAGVRLRPGRSDSDLDQEILLQARSVMRDREDVSPRLVALAQAAAARQVLLRYVAGDDVGTSTWGRRYLPLLAQHPDAALLKDIVTVAWDGLSVPPPAEPPHIVHTDAAPAAWSGAITTASAAADRARRFLRTPPAEEPGRAAADKKGKKDKKEKREEGEGEGDKKHKGASRSKAAPAAEDKGEE